MIESKIAQHSDHLRIGIVLPVYRHSGLVVEALISLEQQQKPPGFVVVIVNDGCPFDETDRVCRSFAQFSDIKNVHYIRRINGGLSAARNTGISFLLKKYPQLEGIYFLDADNRLKPYALARMARVMDQHLEADWFYPDIQMFGLDTVAHYDGVYSGLIHTSSNISEAGSLVRRRVFDAGVEFDENMRQGFEDWDFWLGARERGFKGLHIKNMGFEYRKRPESMLAESNRDEIEIKAYMRRKRRTIFQIQNLLSLEAEEAPRYAVLIDGTKIQFKLDPNTSVGSVSLADYVRAFWSWSLRPDTHFIPPFVVCASESSMKIAQDAGLLRWIFWDLEARCRSSHISSTTIRYDDSSFCGIKKEEDRNYNFYDDAHFIMINVEILKNICKDPDGLTWWNNISNGNADLSTKSRVVTISNSNINRISANLVVHDLSRLISYLFRSEFSSAQNASWKWAWSGVPARHTAYLTVRGAANDGVVLPRQPDGRKHVAFVLSFVDFGGVEKVAFNVARVLKSAGYVPHLVMFREGNIHISTDMSGIFESISWFATDRLLSWDGESYYGSKLSWWSQYGDRRDAIGLLGSFDVVINCQSADAHGVMGDLRRCGALTITHQHLVEFSNAGRPGGNAMLARAFEHSYAMILAASLKLHDWFVASGIPQEKLLTVDNASSFSIAHDALTSIKNERIEKYCEEKMLRVVFAGRLDEQKGIDRLLEIVKKSKSNFEWRIVGKPVVEDGNFYQNLRSVCIVEPPIYQKSELIDLYRWADILVLPSRYEGVPLTVIEAMSCGVVVVAADAGAVSEVIQHKVDGFIVSQETSIDDTLNILEDMNRDRQKMHKISMNAMYIYKKRSWNNSLSSFVKYLDERFSSIGRS